MYGLENVVRKHFYMRLLKNTDDDNMCAGVCVCACVCVCVRACVCLCVCV